MALRPLSIKCSLLESGDRRVLILNHEPPAAPLDHHEGPDMLLVLVVDSVWRRERTHQTDHRHDCSLSAHELHLTSLYLIGNALQECGVDSPDFLQHVGATASPAPVWVDVHPILSCEVGRSDEALIERRIKQLDRFSSGSFVVLAASETCRTE